MTGPEHYREAERLAVSAADYAGLPSNAHIQDGQLAQAHALLANAAANAMNFPVGDGMAQAERRAWRDVAGAQPSQRAGTSAAVSA
jgi:hypothetical protein